MDTREQTGLREGWGTQLFNNQGRIQATRGGRQEQLKDSSTLDTVPLMNQIQEEAPNWPSLGPHHCAWPRRGQGLNIHARLCPVYIERISQNEIGMLLPNEGRMDAGREERKKKGMKYFSFKYLSIEKVLKWKVNP